MSSSSQYNISQLDQTTAQINSLLQSSKEDLNCGPDCQKEKTSQQLQSDYLNAKNNMLSAPYKLKQAQKAYITYTEGDASYNSVIKQELLADANNMTAQMEETFSKAIRNAYEELGIYETLHDNYFNLSDLLKKYVVDNDKLRSKLETEKDDTITNDRKTFYENQHYNVVLTRFGILRWVYGVVYVIFFFIIFLKENEFTIQTKVMIVLLFLVYPFVITHLVLFVFKKMKELYDLLPSNIYNQI
jgi:hypothetical protein